MARVDARLAERLDGELEADLRDNGRLGLVRRYLRGDHDQPYMPAKAKKEYKHLARVAITNWTPLLSDTYSKGLHVDGYRESRASTNSQAWEYWQANGLDARQSVAHRGALEYGASYALILPGKAGRRSTPYFRPQSPLKTSALYLDDDDEFPEIGFRRRGTTVDGTRLLEVFDKTSVYTFARPNPQPGEEAHWRLSRTDEHGLGVTPLVRFRDRIDGEARGIIAPVKNLQDRINEVVFATLIAIQYASFRQKWATGLAIPEDENGEPIEPFDSAVDRLWVSEEDGTKFGDFAQTELSGHTAQYELAVKTMAGISQISPNILTGDLVNLSADALAAMEKSTQDKIGEYETLFGESWESGFRLAAKAAGNRVAARDTSSQVRWRDTEARSLAQTVDALGKMAQMLAVPVEALWEEIPGITDGDVARWKELKQSDPLGELVSEIQRQGSSTPATPAASDDSEE